VAKAVAAGYRLQPGNVACANNYAATLLVNRDRSEEAVSLTLQTLGRFPDSNAAKINHALALLLNRRIAEAQAILNTVGLEKLSAQEANSFYLGRFEVLPSTTVRSSVGRQRPDRRETPVSEPGKMAGGNATTPAPLGGGKMKCLRH